MCGAGPQPLSQCRSSPAMMVDRVIMVDGLFLVDGQATVALCPPSSHTCCTPLPGWQGQRCGPGLAPSLQHKQLLVSTWDLGSLAWYHFNLVFHDLAMLPTYYTATPQTIDTTRIEIWVFFSFFFWSWNNVTPWFFRAKEFVKHRQHCSIRKQFWLIQLPYLDTTELKCCLIEPDPTCWCPCPSRRGGSHRGCSARTRGQTGDLSGSGALEPWAAKWRSAKRKQLHWEGKQLQGGAKLWKLRGETLKCTN